jgi:LPXTG-motif cell wall-anchored protein
MAKTQMRVLPEQSARLPYATRLRRIAVASVLGAGLAAGLCAAEVEPVSAAPALAAAYGTAAATVTAGVHNTAITVDVHGLTPGETVTIYIASTPTLLGQATASSAGIVNATFPLPAGLAAGTHTVTVMGSATNLSTVVYLTSSTGPVADPSTPLDPAPSSTQLPHTGADIAAATTLGAVLVAGGGVLVLSSRRRRRPAVTR